MNTKINTPAGRKFRADVTVDAFGRTTYRLTRKIGGVVTAIGSVVVFPDWRLEPKDNRVTLQFGEGSLEDRHSRAHVPTADDLLYLVGTPVVDRARMLPGQRWFKADVSLAPTGAPTSWGDHETRDRVGDMLLAIVMDWESRADHADIVAAYAKFRAGDRIAALTAKSQRLDEKIAPLAAQRDKIDERIAALNELIGAPHKAA